MNRRLTDLQLRSLAREILIRSPTCTGREFRRAVRERFAAAGNTARIFNIWRMEREGFVCTPPAPVALDQGDAALLHIRIREAEQALIAYRERAERAEYREDANQDRWAMEVDRLREQLRQQPNYAAEVRRLQQRVTELTVQLSVLRGAHHELSEASVGGADGEGG